MRASPLKPGDTIGVMAPSSYVEQADIEAASSIIQAAGFRVKVHPQTFAREHQSAGSHDEKLAAFHEVWMDETVGAVWAAGGGNRALHLLEGIRYDRIALQPKHLIGFSDVTALLNAITARTGLVTWHGPVFRKLPAFSELPDLLALLGGSEGEMPADTMRVLRPGAARGPLIGGNLSVFHYLAGTPFLPDPSGAILFLEDCNEETSRLDRMLLHLRRSGILAKISGLVFGSFGGLKDSGRPFGYTLDDIIGEHTRGLSIPVVTGAPFGHGERLYPLPVGGMAEVTATKRASLRLLV